MISAGQVIDAGKTADRVTEITNLGKALAILCGFLLLTCLPLVRISYNIKEQPINNADFSYGNNEIYSNFT